MFEEQARHARSEDASVRCLQGAAPALDVAGGIYFPELRSIVCKQSITSGDAQLTRILRDMPDES